MIDRFGKCPNCEVSWDRGDILLQLKTIHAFTSKSESEMVKLASEFGYSSVDKKHFSRVIAIQVHKSQSQPDDVSLYECPECRHVWNADTEEHFDSILQAKENLSNNVEHSSL